MSDKDPLSPLYTDGDTKREVSEKSTDPSALSEEPYRTDFRRDFARLIHSTAFRRLRGKQQLFPDHESDYFRNRLTHSMEVAQIAKSIAIKINYECEPFSNAPIDLDLIELAGLAHDLGHPPFGHEGEMALDKKMLSHGGFEGNAQSLRILSRIEKKVRTEPDLPMVGDDGSDYRRGLNLTYRSLAAVLKYDRCITASRGESSGVMKGYYQSEAPLVDEIKNNIAGGSWVDFAGAGQEFKTVECQIMDIADDIAYSTYDLDDALKAGMFGIFDILAKGNDFWQLIADKASATFERSVTPEEVYDVVLEIFESQKIFEAFTTGGNFDSANVGEVASRIGPMHQAAQDLAHDGFYRNTFTSHLVGEFIRAVTVEPAEECLSFSRVSIEQSVWMKVEVLKQLAYTFLVESPRWRLFAKRSREIVNDIFEVLAGPKGHELMPEDFRTLYLHYDRDENAKKRTICDYISCMTDKYAVEFYNRIRSGQAPQFFKPH